jgi:hypothetical protein
MLAKTDDKVNLTYQYSVDWWEYGAPEELPLTIAYRFSLCVGTITG